MIHLWAPVPGPLSASSSTGPPCPVLQVPPGGNSLRISVLGSILIADTQHDCQALPHSVLTTQYGEDGSKDTGA